MDAVHGSSPNPSPAGGLKKVFSRSSRSQTTPSQDFESISSSRSNGRSSIDSTSESQRPKTSGGPASEESSSRISKLLANRRKKKNNNNRLTASSTSADSAVQQSADGDAEEVPASGSSANGSVGAQDPSGGSINLLTDDSEPDQ
jgi:hypothetical protein